MAAQHNSMADPHCAGPLSPPLMSGLEEMTGIPAITEDESSVQVVWIPAIPSPTTVLFNSSQQMAQTGMYQPLQMDQTPPAARVELSQSPHAYDPLCAYCLTHQSPPNLQLSNAYGHQSLFVQPPAAHQGQDLYSSCQYTVQPPYPQSQDVSSNQVMGVQQNLNSHLFGSQLVQTRPDAGPSPAAPHFQSLNGLQAVQPTPQISYFSTSAQPQTANYYHQPPETPRFPMQQQLQYPFHQIYGSQSALNALPQTATPNFRNYGSYQYKSPSSVMNNIVPEAASLRSTTRSPTVDVSKNRKFSRGQANAFSANRINSGSNKISQYSLPQSQQHYYPFAQQKFEHVLSNTVRPPQVLFPNVMRNPPHQQLPAVAIASNMHYPSPIQRLGPAAADVAQAATQPNSKIEIRPQASVLVPGDKLISAQQAKLRAEALQLTHMFFAQCKTEKQRKNCNQFVNSRKNKSPK